MLPEQRAPIVTPEAVPLDLPVAGVGSRALAFLLDWIIIGAALVALLFALNVFGGGAPAGGGWLGITVILMLVFGLVFGYPVAFETLRRGRTPGKMAMGLRVVTVEGAPVRFRHAAVRAALGIVDFQVTLGIAAVLSAVLSERSQRLGDLAAGTLVLRERTGADESKPLDVRAPSGLETYVERLDVRGLQPGTYAAVRQLLQRAPELPDHVRDRLARDLASQVRTQVQPQPPDTVGPLAFLEATAAAVQGRRRPVSPPGPRSPSTPRAEDDDRPSDFAPPA